jgi:pimeloyl-ACP methyl ester carboxylesterase
VTDSWAIADDGLRLFVRTIGDGPQTVIVPGAAWLEEELAALCTPGRRVVFYDTQSRGRSEIAPVERLTFDREVDDLEAVRRYVGADRVSVIGWSYQGAVAALYASRHPAHVAHVAMLCPMTPRPGPFDGMAPYVERRRAREAEVADRLAALRAAAERDPSPATWRACQLLRASTNMGAPADADRVVADPWQHENEWAPHAESVLDVLFDSLDDFDWRPAMAVVDAAVLVVHGENEGPAGLRQEWVDAVPHGRLLSLPGVGHYPFVERRQETLAALDELLRA